MDLAPALAMGTIGFVLVAYMTLAAVPADGPVAVVFPPWSDRLANWGRVAEAGGLVVREAVDGRVMVVRPDGPDFARRIVNSGAWGVVNPLSLGGCGSGPVT